MRTCEGMCKPGLGDVVAITRSAMHTMGVNIVSRVTPTDPTRPDPIETLVPLLVVHAGASSRAQTAVHSFAHAAVPGSGPLGPTLVTPTLLRALATVSLASAAVFAERCWVKAHVVPKVCIVVLGVPLYNSRCYAGLRMHAAVSAGAPEPDV